MAAVAAGPVFRLLGARDLGETRDCHTAKMPAVNVGLVDGELAWRQHDGGHEDRSNLTHFIEWANRLIEEQPRRADDRNDEGPVAGRPVNGISALSAARIDVGGSASHCYAIPP